MTSMVRRYVHIECFDLLWTGGRILERNQQFSIFQSEQNICPHLVWQLHLSKDFLDAIIPNH